MVQVAHIVVQIVLGDEYQVKFQINKIAETVESVHNMCAPKVAKLVDF